MSLSNMEILDYFNWKAFKTPPYHYRLHDTSNIPLPLLSYAINKLLPGCVIGYQDKSLQEIRDGFTAVDKDEWVGILTGSTAEGLQIFSCDSTRGINVSLSDADFMIVPKSPPPLDVHDKLTPTALVDELLETYPGYVILTQKGTSVHLTKSLKEITDVDSYIKSVFPHQCEFKQEVGPSQKVNLEYTEDYNNTVICEVDFVYALPCNQWPRQASEWPKRDRPGQWPSSTQVESIVKGGVHYVKKSPSHVIREHLFYFWRISFSVAERELCKMFNDTQRQCAVLLKLVKQKYIIPKDVITSYHLKTIMFWACEEIPMSKWKPERVGHCFIYVLDRLYLAVVKGSLNHYFINEFNLFEHNISKPVRMSIIKTIVDVRNNLFKLLQVISTSYDIIHMQHKQQIFGIKNMTESFYKKQLQEDLMKTSSDLLKIFSINFVIAINKYKKYGRNLQFNEEVKYMEEIANVIGTAIKYKQYCSDVVKLAVLAVCDEESIIQYYEYIKVEHGISERHSSVINQSLFYKEMLQKYASDSSVIAAAKSMVPTFEKIFT